MLNVAFSLRYIMFVASLGAAMGALVMLWEGCVKLFGALRVFGATGDEGAGTVIGFVMGATDEFLFALVLLIFAYAIAFGFVIDLAPEDRERLPAWMRISSISELKHTLIEVILVYLVVDFATDTAEKSGPHHHEWGALVLPASILLIAGALRLVSRERPTTD
jgi:uncharacterized membrane protein YqhA